VPRRKKPIEKKVIKEKPKHPRPPRNIRWSEKKEERPTYKKKKKRDREVEKDLLSD
jgi:hypothetical protein